MEVAQGVHRFGSRFVNWYVVEDGRALTLVDAGLLGQWSQFTDAVERLGRRMADVEAIVLTHAHVDRRRW
jgi:glyoxylase-like metal-dependent hydrolase (beta-lactamase superfamily II)